MTTAALTASARVVARLGPAGVTHLAELRSAPPLSLRRAAGALWMVGSAAGPLPGDRVALSVGVGAGASLTVRSTAASVALGAHGDDHSEFLVEAEVGAGGELRWLPEPTVASAGCHHRYLARIRLGAGARLVWRDELVLGRHGEGPGRLTSRIDIDAAGVPLLRHELRVGPGEPGWEGPAITGGAGAVGMVVVIGPRDRAGAPPPGAWRSPEAAMLPLAGGGAVMSAMASGAHELRRQLDTAWLWGPATLPTGPDDGVARLIAQE